MLFSGNGKFMYDLATCKHIAEIILKDDRPWFLGVFNESPGQVLNFVESVCGRKDVDGLTGIVIFLRDKLNMPAPQLDSFKRAFSSYLVGFQESLLPREYLVVPEAEKAVRRYVESTLRQRAKGRFVRLSDSDWSQIFLEVRKFVTNNSCNFGYDASTGGIIKWLISSTEKFMLNFPKDIWESLISIGLNQEIEGTDFGAIDYHDEEALSVEDFNNFDILANNIYRVSDFMYRHGGEVYYDIFSRYKYKKVVEYRELIERDLNRMFQFAGLRTPTRAVDANFMLSSGRSSEVYKYASKKKAHRDVIMSYLDPLIEGRAGLSELSEILGNILSYNRTIPGKDKQPVFDTDSYTSKDKLDNNTKLEYLFTGAVSLKRFLEYLRDNHINVFSVPSVAFKDDRYIRRFPTFSRYMKYLGETEKLIKEEQYSSEFLSNDMVYLELMKGSSQVIDNVPLKSIKNVIDGLIERGREVKKPEIENLYDVEKLKFTSQVWRLFHNSTNTQNLAGKVASERETYNRLKNFLREKGILKQEGGFWSLVAKNIKFEDILKLRHNNDEEKVKRSLVFASMVQGDEQEKYLGYLRTMGFIEFFLSYVRELLSLTYVGTDSTEVVATTYFKIFLTINENRELFSPPKSPTNYHQFSDLMDRYNFEYYLPEDYDEMKLNEHLVGLYNLMYKVFEMFLDYISELYQSVFLRYSEGVALDYSEDYGVRDLLKKAGFELYHFRQNSEVSNHAAFEKFKNLSIIDKETGFLMKDGKFYKKVAFVTPRYLHESGYWVTIQDNETFNFLKIAQDEEFG